MKDFPGIIIPYKNAVEIARVCEWFEDDLSVIFNKNHISFFSDTVHITSRLIDGSFPDYKQIIPKEEKTKIIILKQDLIQALKTTTIFTNKFNQITLTVKTKEKFFSLESKNADVGEGVVALDAAISGEDVGLNVNMRYFSDCLSHIHHDSVLISFNGAGRPIVVSGASDASFTYLVMPMNR